MAAQPPVTDEIFPQHSGKSYALVETMRAEGPLVGKGPDDTVFAFPIVLLIEGLLLLGVTLAIFLFSLVKQAPLDTIANPLVTVDPAKAPWYFMGLQELLEHMHPLVAGVILPSRAGGFPDRAALSRSGPGRGRGLVLLRARQAYRRLDGHLHGHRHDRPDRPRQRLQPARNIARPGAEWLAQGLLPAAILLAVVAVPPLIVWLAGRRSGTPASMRELLLALFTVMFISAIVFTLSGFLFRGPGFKMYWPWQMPNGYNPWDGL